jgi:hypothetical protein
MNGQNLEEKNKRRLLLLKQYLNVGNASAHVCMYVCMYVCIFVFMYMYVFIFVSMSITKESSHKQGCVD